MLKPRLNIFIFLILLFSLLSCSVKNNDKPESDFSVMVLTDIHISNDAAKDNRLRDIVSAMNKGKFDNLEMLITTGDNVSSFYDSRYQGDSFRNNRAAKFNSIIDTLRIPHYIALGNHDYKIDRDKDSDAPFSFNEIDTMEVLWKKFAGVVPYQAVDLNGWKFILLNSMRGRYLERAFDDDQMEWFGNQLKEGKQTLLFFHHPIKTDSVLLWAKPKDLITPEKEPEFFTLVKEYQDHIKGIFVGHGHMWIHDKLFGNIPVYETASFGDDSDSPYRLIQINTGKEKINVTRQEFIDEQE